MSVSQVKSRSQRKVDYLSSFWEQERVQRVKIILICMDLIHLLSEYVMETTLMDLTLYSGWKILIVSVDEAEDADEDEDEVVVVGEGGVDEEEGEAVVVVTAEEGVVVVVLVTAHIKKDGKTISKVDSELIIFNKPEEKKIVLSYGFTKLADVETPNDLMVL